MTFSSTIGAIVGSAFDIQALGEEVLAKEISTPFDAAPVPLRGALLDSSPLWLLARHGPSHSIPPHRINYRANLWALKEAGVKKIIAVAAVGGIAESMGPGRLLVPDQIIDYSWGREHTFADRIGDWEDHIDFTCPYNRELSETLLDSARSQGLSVMAGGVYGCTQGPRLETAAEIRKLRRDGCDVVGMTGMPEASLARELGMDYACLAIVINWAAGVSDAAVDLTAAREASAAAAEKIKLIIASAAARLQG